MLGPGTNGLHPSPTDPDRARDTSVEGDPQPVAQGRRPGSGEAYGAAGPDAYHPPVAEEQLAQLRADQPAEVLPSFRPVEATPYQRPAAWPGLRRIPADQVDQPGPAAGLEREARSPAALARPSPRSPPRRAVRPGGRSRYGPGAGPRWRWPPADHRFGRDPVRTGPTGPPAVAPLTGRRAARTGAGLGAAGRAGRPRRDGAGARWRWRARHPRVRRVRSRSTPGRRAGRGRFPRGLVGQQRRERREVSSGGHPPIVGYDGSALAEGSWP